MMSCRICRSDETLVVGLAANTASHLHRGVSGRREVTQSSTYLLRETLSIGGCNVGHSVYT